jgi:DNA-binding Lrp family transcriptional regulator
MTAAEAASWTGRHAEAGQPGRDEDGVDLDTLDLTLIDELQRDGRVPFAQVARVLGVTEKTVRRRVARLVEQRFITIAAVTDPATLGFGGMALALVTTEGHRSPAEIAADLAQLPETDYVSLTTGPFAMQVELVGDDIAQLNSVANDKIRPVPGVRSVELLPYLRLHYQQARFSAQRDESAGVRPRPLDDTDRAIVGHLAVDGRAPLKDIAAALGVSEAKIRFRYAKLVDSGALRVMCIANPLRLGHRFTSWVAVRVGGNGNAQVVAEALTQLTSVSYVAITAGRCDVLAEVVARTGEQLLSILDENIRTIEGVVEVQSWLYTGLHYKPIRPRGMGLVTGHASDTQMV